MSGIYLWPSSGWFRIILWNKKEKNKKDNWRTGDAKKKIELEERLMNNEIESSTCQTSFKKFKEDKVILESSVNGNQKIGNEKIKSVLMPFV